MAAVVADQRREGVSIKPDQRATESTGQPPRFSDRSGTVLAGCVFHVRCADILCAPMRSSTAGNSQLLCASHTLSAFREQCSKYLWTICIPPDTIFVTFV